jgi:hypothetical protein
MLGSCFELFYLPTAGTRGGILVAWHTDKWCCSHVHLSDHAMAVKVKHYIYADPWWLTTVYRQQEDQEKVAFLQELSQLRVGRLGPWLLCGDFNFIYKVTDKNNGRTNHHLMGKVCRFLQDMELMELHLQGRLYTWSNEQAHPTLVRNDKAFACVEWGDRFPHHRLHTLSSSCLDHAPLHLCTDTSHIFHR